MSHIHDAKLKMENLKKKAVVNLEINQISLTKSDSAQ